MNPTEENDSTANDQSGSRLGSFQMPMQTSHNLLNSNSNGPTLRYSTEAVHPGINIAPSNPFSNGQQSFNYSQDLALSLYSTLLQQNSSHQSMFPHQMDSTHIVSQNQQGIQQFPITNSMINTQTQDQSKKDATPPFFQNMALRSGKWTLAEEQYADALIAEFEKGTLLDCANGLTLRAYLSKKLHCGKMRISKKFAGKSIGKHVFLSRVSSSNNAAYFESVKKLNALEQNFHIAVAHINSYDMQSSTSEAGCSSDLSSCVNPSVGGLTWPLHQNPITPSNILSSFSNGMNFPVNVNDNTNLPNILPGRTQKPILSSSNSNSNDKQPYHVAEDIQKKLLDAYMQALTREPNDKINSEDKSLSNSTVTLENTSLKTSKDSLSLPQTIHDLNQGSLPTSLFSVNHASFASTDTANQDSHKDMQLLSDQMEVLTDEILQLPSGDKSTVGTVMSNFRDHQEETLKLPQADFDYAKELPPTQTQTQPQDNWDSVDLSSRLSPGNDTGKSQYISTLADDYCLFAQESVKAVSRHSAYCRSVSAIPFNGTASCSLLEKNAWAKTISPITTQQLQQDNCPTNISHKSLTPALDVSDFNEMHLETYIKVTEENNQSTIPKTEIETNNVKKKEKSSSKTTESSQQPEYITNNFSKKRVRPNLVSGSERSSENGTEGTESSRNSSSTGSSSSTSDNDNSDSASGSDEGVGAERLKRKLISSSSSTIQQGEGNDDEECSMKTTAGNDEKPIPTNLLKRQKLGTNVEDGVE